MPHNQAGITKAHQAGITLARLGETRAYVNDVARTLDVNEADALFAGYYFETRRLDAARRVNLKPGDLNPR